MPEWKEEIRQRLASLKLAPAREAEVVEELSQHLKDYYAELRAGGATPEEALRVALEELGASESLAQEQQRVERPVAQEPIVPGTTRRTNMIADLWQDLRFGARMLVKKPGFTLIVVITLALGIGANTAIFTLINVVMLKSLPVSRPEELVMLTRSGGDSKNPSSFSQALWEQIRDHQDVFSEVCAYGSTSGADLSAGGEARPVGVGLVSGGFFSTLGACASVTSASPRAASARAWPVPTEMVFTVRPVCFSNIGTSTSSNPESWVLVVVDRITTVDWARLEPATTRIRPRAISARISMSVSVIFEIRRGTRRASAATR